MGLPLKDLPPVGKKDAVFTRYDNLQGDISSGRAMAAHSCIDLKNSRKKDCENKKKVLDRTGSLC